MADVTGDVCPDVMEDVGADMETKWLTYDELAEALKIAPDSARRLVARRKWPKRLGNDGRARIEVPVDKLTPDSPADSPEDITPDVSPDVRDDVTPDITLSIRVLTEHIERLEKEIAGVKAERDAERARGAEIDALRAVLEVERKHADELRAERDRLLAMVTEKRRSWWPWKRAVG